MKKERPLQELLPFARKPIIKKLHYTRAIHVVGSQFSYYYLLFQLPFYTVFYLMDFSMFDKFLYKDISYFLSKRCLAGLIEVFWVSWSNLVYDEFWWCAGKITSSQHEITVLEYHNVVCKDCFSTFSNRFHITIIFRVYG